MAIHKVSVWGLALNVSDDYTFQIETQLGLAGLHLAPDDLGVDFPV